MHRKKWRRKRRRPAFQFPKDWGPIELVTFVKGAEDQERYYTAETVRHAGLPWRYFAVAGRQTAEQLAEQPDPPEVEWLGTKYFNPNVVRLLASSEEVRDASS